MHGSAERHARRHIDGAAITGAGQVLKSLACQGRIGCLHQRHVGLSGLRYQAVQLDSYQEKKRIFILNVRGQQCARAAWSQFCVIGWKGDERPLTSSGPGDPTVPWDEWAWRECRSDALLLRRVQEGRLWRPARTAGRPCRPAETPRW